MKRVTLLLALAALIVPATALSKGPTAATIDGPGGPDGGITITGNGESPGTSLGDLTMYSGFIPAVFDQQPDPMLASRPKGDLGPKYTVTYTVPGPNNDVFTIRQDVYPYATPAPVTYMEPGQRIFEGMKTRGGWYPAGPELKETLVSAGLPASPSAADSSDGWSLPTFAVGLLTAMLVLAGATAVVLRRRTRPAAA
jgi:hypothetical protein